MIHCMPHYSWNKLENRIKSFYYFSSLIAASFLVVVKQEWWTINSAFFCQRSFFSIAIVKILICDMIVRIYWFVFRCGFQFHIHYSLPTKRVQHFYAINLRPVWLRGASPVQREWSDWLSSFSVQQGINFILDRQIWPSFYPFYSPVCLKKGWYLYHAKNEFQHWVSPRKWLFYLYLQDLVAIYR